MMLLKLFLDFFGKRTEEPADCVPVFSLWLFVLSLTMNREIKGFTWDPIRKGQQRSMGPY